MYKIRNYILDMLSVTISANIIIIPIMGYHFNMMSFTFWLSNLLAGPFLGLIIILGFIVYFISIVTLPVASVLAFLLQLFLMILIHIAEFCSNLPFSSILLKTPTILEIVSYYSFIYFAFIYDKEKRDHIMTIIKQKLPIVVIAILILSIIFVIGNYTKGLRIYFVDVGQGDCMLICTPNNKTILVDGGGSENSNFDVGEKVLLPYLLGRRIKKIDYMLISHFDSDHCRTDC